MTNASELFKSRRRSRLGRNTTDTELGFHSSLDRISHHNPNNGGRHNNRRDRHDLDGCNTPRRPSISTNPIHRPSFPERESIRPDQASSQSASGNVLNSEDYRSIHNGQRFSGSDRLPGPVLLARERLLERLRGVSPSGNRQSNGASPGIHHRGITFGGNIRLVDPEDLEIEISSDWVAGVTPFFTNSNS